MKKKTTNYDALMQLAAFSVGAEEDVEAMTAKELDDRLSAQGIDLLKLEQRTLAKLKRLKNELDASQAADRLRTNLKSRLTVVEMRSVLQEEGQLLAAKAKGTLADEDIEALYRLTHPEEADGA